MTVMLCSTDNYNSPYCQCDDNEPQSGDHLTFRCPRHAQIRHALINDKQSWQDLDCENWIKVAPNERADGVEMFFAYLFDQLTK